jgi:hypothetical protein
MLLRSKSRLTLSLRERNREVIPRLVLRETEPWASVQRLIYHQLQHNCGEPEITSRRGKVEQSNARNLLPRRRPLPKVPNVKLEGTSGSDELPRGPQAASRAIGFAAFNWSISEFRQSVKDARYDGLSRSCGAFSRHQSGPDWLLLNTYR